MLNRTFQRIITAMIPLFFTLSTVMGSIEIKGIDIQLPHEERIGKGKLVLSSIPSRAKVYINGTYEGMTPLERDVLPGSYEIKMIKRYYGTVIHDVYVDPGKTVNRAYSLPSRRSAFIEGFIMPVVVMAIAGFVVVVMLKS